MKSHIRRAPLWLVPLVVAALVAVLGWWGNQRLRDTVTDELGSDLSQTLDANVTALEIWATNQLRLATALADEPAFRALAVRMLAAPPHTPEVDRARFAQELGDYLHLRLQGLGYETAHLVNTNLFVVSALESGLVQAGWTVAPSHVTKFSELFASGKPVLITPFRSRSRLPSPSPAAANSVSDSAPGQPVRPRSNTLMQIAAPLRDEHGTIQGALALVINPDQEFARILSVARAGKSGETYAFDQRGLMLSRSRFEAQLRELGLIESRPGVNSAAGLRLADPGVIDKPAATTASSGQPRRPLTWLVANAVAGGRGVDVEPSRDYRGVPVVGAWRWMPAHGFGVVTQLDADEAFAPLRVLNLLFAILFLLLALFATGMFLASYLGALWRRRLSEATLKLKQLGQYTLERKIGEGAMGIVYRARHGLLRRDTAIKLLLPDRADAVTLQRFEREVQLSSQLSHPCTIQVYDYGHTAEGVFYYAMELLRGMNLQDLVRQFGPQPEGRVVYILVQVCEALAEAHGLGVVHRDIKPANIFICDRGGLYDWVKVLDYGLVRAYHDGSGNRACNPLELTEGTPLYMPPEAFADSAAADPRSDIYSLGAVAYYLLTGEHLFEAESELDLYHKHAETRPVPPGQRSTQVISAELEELVLRCLEKEPNLRVQSTPELRALLLMTPQADAWSVEDRAAWWTQFRLAQGMEAAKATH